jgi:hypothetical protein
LKLLEIEKAGKIAVRVEAIAAKIPVQGYVLWVHRGRRFECVKAVLLKRVVTIAEQLAK